MYILVIFEKGKYSFVDIHGTISRSRPLYNGKKDVLCTFLLSSKEFKKIRSANSSISKATVQWTRDWISNIDALIQLNVMKRNHSGISTPKLIQELVIDVNEQVSDDSIQIAEIFDLYDIVRLVNFSLHCITCLIANQIALVYKICISTRLCIYFHNDFT